MDWRQQGKTTDAEHQNKNDHNDKYDRTNDTCGTKTHANNKLAHIATDIRRAQDELQDSMGIISNKQRAKVGKGLTVVHNNRIAEANELKNQVRNLTIQLQNAQPGSTFWAPSTYRICPDTSRSLITQTHKGDINP